MPVRDTRIAKVTERDLDAVSVLRPGFAKHYITVHPPADGYHFSLFETLSEFLRSRNASIVVQDVFGSCKFHADGMQALERTCGTITWPVTWIQSDSTDAHVLTGTQVYAVSGTPVRALDLDGHIVGSTFEDDGAAYCYLGNTYAMDTATPKPEQARKTLEKIGAALSLAGMGMSNVVRTWMYVDNILTWYDDFNRVRTDFFTERGVFEGIVPASTGIGVGNPMGAAVVADVFAIKPKQENVSIREILSPRQCPATDYRSSFSRAVELALPDHRRLYVSGTASIEPKGKTIHVGDTGNQISLTMEVVGDILESRDMSWADTSRAVVYFKNMKDVPLFDAYCKNNHLSTLPVAVAHADICRDDLLFEIEADMVRTDKKEG